MAPGLSGYEAVRAGVTYYRHPAAGYLQVTGPDRFDFLQRQMTNDAKRLSTGGTMVSVLTSPRARILDVWLMVADEEWIGLITLPGRAEATAQFLQGRIFFMDNVTVTDSSAEYAQFSLEGPGASQLLSELGLSLVPSRGEVVTGELAGVGGRVIGQQGLSEDSFRLLVDAADGDTVTESLEAANIPSITPDVYDVLRIEAGIPGPRTELTEDYTPLEMNLKHAISDSKGCYTGQEVIARQVTYDKVTQQLVGLRLGGQVAVGDALQVDGKRAGVVTSVARSPRLDWIGLGVVKRPYHEVGTEVVVLAESGDFGAEIVLLPFE